MKFSFRWRFLWAFILTSSVTMVILRVRDLGETMTLASRSERNDWRRLFKSSEVGYVWNHQQKIGQGPPETSQNSKENREGLLQKQGDLDRQLPQIKVIILTYMRSGSSLTGDLLQQHPGVFYVFEPLWMTEKFYYNNFPGVALKLLNDTIFRMPSSLEQLNSLYSGIIDSFLSCHLEEIETHTLTQYHMVQSRSTKEAANCSNFIRDSVKLRECLQRMYNNCQVSKVRVVKVIRLDMEKAKRLMTRDPDVKVIHLIRDPRGVLRSQYQVGMVNWEELTTEARRFCQRLENDVTLGKIVSRALPDRMLTVRYEDITNHPIEATRKMYGFLNLRTTPEIEKYIWNITFAGNPDSCEICTTRSNATVSAYQWRHTMDINSVLAIQRQCAGILHTMGYRMFQTKEDLKNDQISPAIFQPGQTFIRP